MNSEEYLGKIRKSPGLKRAILKKITVERSAVTFFLVTDLSYGEEDVRHALAVTREAVPAPFEAKVDLIKSVPDGTAVKREIFEIFRRKFPSAAAFLREEDVLVMTEETGGRFLLRMSREEKAYLERSEGLNELTRELLLRFCGAWSGGIVLREREEEAIEPLPVGKAEKQDAPRIFEIRDYVAIDGASPKFALYCGDLAGEQREVTVCGEITELKERMTKAEKPFFRITVSDKSGSVQALYFSRKETLEKIRALKVGDFICMTGEQKLFNGAYSFTAKKIDYGFPPENFVPAEREGKSAPAAYLKIFPEPLEDPVQANFFETKGMPEDFKEQTFVVFDLETTGLNCAPGIGMDRIIEIGAVKIKAGRIFEKFSSFVACPVKLGKEIRELTGIEDSMLVGAPEIGEAIGDFYKFAEGSILVGHNVMFDSKFIHYYGEAEGYLFRNGMYDTLIMSQEMLRLNNYKLNTVASHFGFEFRHHRAFDDAFVTAKIFMRLVRDRGSLPRI